ncbi:MAG: MaoC family dehydratase N-terminal domain-containing protein [Acidobacteria bacterium]|nr:MaoC family dehydratase N-terminal domain-containing protein [Acidobacteriota bacterium]
MTVERFPIEAGHILLFARAIGDPNPIYADPDTAVAPPTFVQASAQFDPDYSLRPKPGQPWMGSAKEPSQLAGGRDEGGSGGSRSGGTGLHAEQHYEYHRPLRPGDVLSATSRPGETWEREGKRGGKMTFSENIIEYRDQKGELVVTARSVGVRTGQVVA